MDYQKIADMIKREIIKNLKINLDVRSGNSGYVEVTVNLTYNGEIVSTTNSYDYIDIERN